MIRITHKETGKALVISNSHATALTTGKHAPYRVDPNWNEEEHKAKVAAVAEAKREAEQLKFREEMAKAAAEEAASAEAEKEVSTAKEEKKSAPKRSDSSK